MSSSSSSESRLTSSKNGLRRGAGASGIANGLPKRRYEETEVFGSSSESLESRKSDRADPSASVRCTSEERDVDAPPPSPPLNAPAANGAAPTPEVPLVDGGPSMPDGPAVPGCKDDSETRVELSAELVPVVRDKSGAKRALRFAGISRLTELLLSCAALTEQMVEVTGAELTGDMLLESPKDGERACELEERVVDGAVGVLVAVDVDDSELWTST